MIISRPCDDRVLVERKAPRPANMRSNESRPTFASKTGASCASASRRGANTTTTHMRKFKALGI